jgi:acid phosphatase class B
MKKIISMLLAVMLIMAVTVPACAVTPKWEYHAPEIPEVTLTDDLKQSISNWVAEYFKNFRIEFTSTRLG